ncbi:uncharacterized protein LAJ45_04430 [Morchella importuna]|uniref:uncharacterized protein n=1 Tax=Morchella importuna TaxID=1174673 RepID=UPI001E8D2369|nr:uncharacterized protein LAJ45_04430 [Morchella importuna]KAH8151808.1 hypothetical protein LAJ45_04430 [Morchella importuna]
MAEIPQEDAGEAADRAPGLHDTVHETSGPLTPSGQVQWQSKQCGDFIRQCENVFSIESQFFTYEEVRIRYAGNLMEGEAPANWYEAYHSSIDQASANRIAGMSVVLDEKWKCWDSFVDALRAAFGEAISRDDAAAQWKALPSQPRVS